MDNIVVDIHAIHTFGPSLINRDDVGAPKTATYGGTLRQRVSSAAFKRAMRMYAADKEAKHFDGIRSKRMVKMLADKLGELSNFEGVWANEHIRRDVAALALTKAELGGTTPTADNKNLGMADAAAPDKVVYPILTTLVFFNEEQLTSFAQGLLDKDIDYADFVTDKKEFEGKGIDFGKLGKKFGKSLENLAKATFGEHNSADISLFGRMMASNTALNVDAAACVSHSISVHPHTAELDFYTAVDDLNTDNHGSVMMGSTQFASSTFYRYATLDMKQLSENLNRDDDATVEVATDFIDAFLSSLPSGKQTSFAAYTLPVCVLITVTRNGRPVTLDSAFFKAVELDSEVEDTAVTKLAQRFDEVSTMYSLTPDNALVLAKPDHADLFGETVETSTNVKDFISAVRTALSK